MIKLVAMDIDDTLLNDELQIPAESKRAVSQAMDQGIVVTLATGRMHQSALPFAKELGMPDDQPIITYNGALVKTIGGELLTHFPLEYQVAVDTIRLCQANGWTLNAYYQDNLYVSELDDNVRYYQDLAQVEVFPVGDLVQFINNGNKELSKLLIVGGADETGDRIDYVKDYLAGKAQVVRSKARFIEITHLQATKGKALEALAQKLGLNSKEVMAIGDSNNDVSMIQYAGVGVAVYSALPEAKAAADHVLGSPDSPAVAEAIVKFILSYHNIS